VATALKFNDVARNCQPIYVNPSTVVAVLKGQHGITVLKTSGGDILVDGTVEEALTLLGWV